MPCGRFENVGTQSTVLPAPDRLNSHPVSGMLGNIAAVLEEADPKLKSQLYEELGIGVTYDPKTRTATAWAKFCVGGPTRTFCTPARITVKVQFREAA